MKQFPNVLLNSFLFFLLLFQECLCSISRVIVFFGNKKKYRKICVLVAAYIDAHPAKENSIIYVFLSLDIVDNYFPCTMKQFLRVSIV